VVVVAGKNAPPVMADLSHSAHCNCHLVKVLRDVNLMVGASVLEASTIMLVHLCLKVKPFDVKS
jgi:hypothetical protein